MKKNNVISPSKKRGLAAAFFIFTLLMSIYACRKTGINSELDVKNETFSSSMHTISYDAEVADSTLHFDLKITSNFTKSIIINESFDIDLKKRNFSKDAYGLIKDKSSNNQYNNLPENEVRMLCKSLKAMISESTKDNSLAQVKDSKVQGMYIGLSFLRGILHQKISLTKFKKINRSQGIGKMSSMGDEDPIDPTDPVDPVDPGDPGEDEMPSLDQGVFEGTALGISPFILNEDIIVNKKALQDELAKDLLQMSSDDKGLYVFQEVLAGMNSSMFTLSDLLREMDDYRKRHPELKSASGWWPSGSSHGCCGNYSGPCLYWHPACYIHDKMCKDCKPTWFCFSGCQPDKAEIDIDDKPFILVEELIEDDGKPIVGAPNFRNFLAFFNLPVPYGVNYSSHLNSTNIDKFTEAKNRINSYNVYIIPALKNKPLNLTLEQRKSVIDDYIINNGIVLSTAQKTSLNRYIDIVYHPGFRIEAEYATMIYNNNLIDYSTFTLCYGIKME